MTAQTRRVLLLPPMLRALDAWLADPSPIGAEVLTREIDGVARLLGLALTRLQVTASPLPDLAFAGADAADGIDHELRSPTRPPPSRGRSSSRSWPLGLEPRRTDRRAR